MRAVTTFGLVLLLGCGTPSSASDEPSKTDPVDTKTETDAPDPVTDREASDVAPAGAARIAALARGEATPREAPVPEPEEAPDDPAEAMKFWADAICRCKDMDCVAGVQRMQEKWLATHGSKAPEDAVEAIEAETKRMVDCVTAMLAAAQ